MPTRRRPDRGGGKLGNFKRTDSPASAAPAAAAAASSPSSPMPKKNLGAMDSTEVLLWLDALGLGKYSHDFEGYSGSDLQGMDTSDWRGIFGHMRPKMTSDEKIRLQEAIKKSKVVGV